MERKKKRYIPVLAILGIFLLITAAILGQYGWMIGLSVEIDPVVLADGSFDAGIRRTGGRELSEEASCLYVWDSGDENSLVLHEEMPQILDDMRVDYHAVDVRGGSTVDLGGYSRVVVGFANYDDNRDLMVDIVDWAEAGGSVLLAQVPEMGSVFRWVSSKIGIVNTGPDYYETAGLRLTSDAMLSGDEKEYAVTYPYASSLIFQLDADCTLHIVTADEAELPLLWEREVGEGQAVAVNLGHYDKSYRGIYAFAYSLLGEYCVWPVINAAGFYLDGFPFPIPEGTSTYVTDVYGGNMDLYTFYVREWWEDLTALAEEYGIRYTATILENNDTDVEPPYEEQGTHNRYQYFLSLLMEMGGDVGLYGYNQQPLCLADNPLTPAYEGEEQDYEEGLGLRYWSSRENMAAALTEAQRFQKSILGGTDMRVYTPPSNIWSEDGIQAVKETLPDIQAVAGGYVDAGYSHGEEFRVDEDGMIYTPRVTSGSYFSDEMKLIALSELNFHYVNTHSISPNDVLNPDAYADQGWPAMLERLKDYEKWLASAAPDMRQANGSETAAAVQRFYYLGVDSELSEEGLTLTLSNFQDEAWLLLRLDGWEPAAGEGGVQGGALTHLQGDLYLLEAEEAQVTIQKGASS